MTVIVTISLALGNTLPLCLVVSPASRPRSCVHPHTDRALPPLPRSPALPPARNVRNENECISDSDKYPNDPTASHGSARPLRARNEQVIAMGRTFIIMPACLSPMCIRRSLVCLCRVCPRSGGWEPRERVKYYRSLFRFYTKRFVLRILVCFGVC